MADRIAASVLLLLTLFYGFVAFQLEAPFQYDPLGPESWPRILAFVMAACCLMVMARPDPEPNWGGSTTLRRLGVILAALVLYALSFEPLGFIVATTLFCTGAAWYGGARPIPALLFGGLLGGVGFFVCTRLLVLNLPSGVLPF